MYGPPYVQGDVIGVGYRPRTGTIFFTRNGKKLDDIVHGLKTQNFFPTVGANGPCTVHVNFGQMGFVFIEANVKKWGLAPMTGSLAPPPPYGSEQGSILLETGRDGPQRSYTPGHSRNRSGIRLGFPGSSPGPQRSATDISLAQLAHIPSQEDVGEPSSAVEEVELPAEIIVHPPEGDEEPPSPPPPEYTSPEGSRRNSDESSESAPLMQSRSPRPLDNPPIPTYDAAIGNSQSPASTNTDDRHE